jgi:hypothetical protein
MLRTFVALAAAIAFTLTFAAPSARAGDDGPPIDAGPPIDVDVFYSKKDPHWAAAEAKLDAVQKKFPRLRLNKTAIDDDAGYKALHEKEQQFGLKEKGDLTIFFGPIPLVSRGEVRNAENWFESVTTRILNPASGKGRLDADAQAFVKSIYGPDAVATPDAKRPADDPLKLYRVTKGAGGEFLGIAGDMYVPIKCPMCNDTQFFVALTPAGAVQAVRPIRPFELYATPMPPEKEAAFLKQFNGLKPAPGQAEVDGIAGATKTTMSYESAISRILAQWAELQGAGK